MRLLILGGTAFVGRHIVEEALGVRARGDLVQPGPDQPRALRGPSNAATVTGTHRTSSSLKAGEWDAVVDVNGYVPRASGRWRRCLRAGSGSYCFISTGSVYADHGPVDTDEDSPAGRARGTEPDRARSTTGRTARSRCCASARSEAAFPRTGLIIRPGIVAGPYDAIGPVHLLGATLTRGGPVLGPERPTSRCNSCTPRTRRRFVGSCMLEEQGPGSFNTVGPDAR